MVGRAAQGRPWIFREITHFLQTGTLLAPPLVQELRRWLIEHLDDHYRLYGEYTGVRSARKHIAWYLRSLPGGEAFRRALNSLESSALQVAAVSQYLDRLSFEMDRLPVVYDTQGRRLEAPPDPKKEESPMNPVNERASHEQ
jgi:tRNA-dihydrouridine synthase B